LPPVAEPVMEAVGALLPELHRLGNDPEASPPAWAGDLAAFELFFCGAKTLFELIPMRNDPALERGVGLQLMPPGPGGEIGVGFGLIQPLHPAFHPDLPLQGLPPEEQS